MRYMISLLLLGIIITLLAVFRKGPEPADLVLRGGKIITVDKEFSVREALAVKKNKIIFVGSNVEAELYVYPITKVIDLQGSVVIPGIIDAHCHPFDLGSYGDEEEFSVHGTASYQQIVKRVAEKVKMLQPGEWIMGRGWDHNDWDVKEYPVHDELSSVSPENPVFLYRIDGNSALVNQRAMDIAGIDRNTPDPYGGKIIRKSNGEPTGMLINMANNIVKKHFPTVDKPDEWYRERYIKAAQISNSAGLTGWHDAGISPRDIEIYKSLVDRSELTVRVYAMLQNPREGNLEEYFRKHKVVNYGNNHFFTVRSVKVFFDGALGSRGAAFFEPYTDDPENRGIFEVPPEHVYEVASAALKTNMQVCTHAIGIRANSVLLDSYQKAFEERRVKDHRFRSEHAEVVRPEDVKRFSELGVIPSMQPTHCTSDMVFCEERIGAERSNYASSWRSFIDAGCIIPCGSDFPVESHKPLWGIYAAVTRRDHQGNPEGGWHPEQRMTREEALRGFTIWAAYAAFQEDVLGSLEKGKLADMVVLDKDILEIEPKEILNTNVLYTIVNGKIVYKRDRQEK